MKRFLPFFFLLIAMVSLSVVSCKKDVEGCTDKDAENYNSEATVSTNCTFARDKFVGNYTGTLNCPTTLTAISGTTTFTIAENISGGKNDVTILITTNTGLIVPVTGTCEDDKVSINTTLQGVEITFQGFPVTADITANGEATYDDVTKTLSGPLNITVIAFGAPYADICAFSGIKQ